jgi:hypothetical protein
MTRRCALPTQTLRPDGRHRRLRLPPVMAGLRAEGPQRVRDLPRDDLPLAWRFSDRVRRALFEAETGARIGSDMLRHPEAHGGDRPGIAGRWPEVAAVHDAAGQWVGGVSHGAVGAVVFGCPA